MLLADFRLTRDSPFLQRSCHLLSVFPAGKRIHVMTKDAVRLWFCLCKTGENDIFLAFAISIV